MASNSSCKWIFFRAAAWHFPKGLNMLPHAGGIPWMFWLKKGISYHSGFSIKKYRRRANDDVQLIEDIARVSNIVLRVENDKRA
jgi:hypothetical protein